jgi:hypothetical protein
VDVVAVGEKGVGQVTADKARAAGDEVTHAVRIENERGGLLRSEARR